MADTPKPIGHWLKHLDGLIEAAFDHALGEDHLQRRHWQALNTLASTPLDRSGLAEALRPFWGDGAVTLDQVTGELLGRGWIAQDDDGTLALTPDGRAAHDAVRARVAATRRTVTDGLSGDEYQATVRVLRRMADNLEAALAS